MVVLSKVQQETVCAQLYIAKRAHFWHKNSQFLRFSTIEHCAYIRCEDQNHVENLEKSGVLNVAIHCTNWHAHIWKKFHVTTYPEGKLCVHLYIWKFFNVHKLQNVVIYMITHYFTCFTPGIAYYDYYLTGVGIHGVSLYCTTEYY